MAKNIFYELKKDYETPKHFHHKGEIYSEESWMKWFNLSKGDCGRLKHAFKQIRAVSAQKAFELEQIN
jgi:hypothetical protein